MKYQWALPLAAALGNAALGAFVLVRDRRALPAAFVLLATALVLWNIDLFALYYFDDPVQTFAWTRIFRIGPILTPTAIVIFVYVFAERSEWQRLLGVWISLGFSVVLLVANAFDKLVVRLQQFDWGRYPVGTRLYSLLSASFVFAVAYSSTVLFLELRTSTSARKRLQVRLWLLSATVALPLGLTNLLPAYGFRIYPLGTLANFVYVSMVAYGIVRHRLMDIDVVVTKGVAYATVTTILIAPIFGVALWIQRASFGQIHPDFSFAILLMLVTVGFLFPALRLRAESRIERSLFREKHEYRAALSAFTRSIVRIPGRDRLVREVTSTLSETLQLDRIAIALLDEATRACGICSAIGSFPVVEEFPENHPFITSLADRQQAVLRDELETSGNHAEQTIALDVYRQNGWEAVIPLTAGDRVVGFIGLGRKINLDAFSAGDLELLETLGAEASVALENARLYEEIERSKEIIRRADRLSALGTLAAGIAHEVRNPLVSIQTFFQLAPERLHDEEFMTTFLGMTASEVKRIASLINELLSFARSPSRSLQTVDLNEALARVVALLDPEARKHQLTLGCVLSGDRLYASADADQLKQVLINLILNAIQATPAGGSVSVITRAVQHRQVAFGQIEIRDTGSGIRADRIEHIFDPFFTTKDTGTGLGLAIAHQIVSEHGGFINVESKEGQGTSFFVDLPACEERDATSHLAEERIDVEPISPTYGRRRKLA